MPTCTLPRLSPVLGAISILAAIAILAAGPLAAEPPGPPGGHDPKPTWDLSSECPTGAAWDGAVAEVEERLALFAKRRGEPILAAAGLADRMDEARTLRARAGSLARCALLTSTLDTTDLEAKARFDAASGLETRAEAGVTWLDGAAGELGAERLSAWARGEPRLERHGWRLARIANEAGHRPPPGGEAAFAALERASQTASKVYDALFAADLGWPRIAGVDGKDVAVDPGTFGELSESRDTAVRRRAVAAYSQRLQGLEEPLGVLLTRKLELDQQLARWRGFENRIDAFFTLGDGTPAGAYRRMIEGARAGKGVLARYARTMARLHGVADIRYADLDVAPPELGREIGLAEAEEIAIGSSAPLGPRYQRALRERLARPWFDLAPRPHKDGGALGVYWQVGGGHPYGVMSYRDTAGSARTLAALAALTMFYADIPPAKEPERREEDFPIYGNAVWFAGSLLQVDYLVANARSGPEKVSLLAGDLRRLWAVFFRGAVEGDFEDRVGALVAAGRPPGGTQLSGIYLATLREYYGGENGAALSAADGREWMTMSNAFYGPVFAEWGFAMAAAAALVEHVSAGDPRTIRAWTEPMGQPGSYTSYDLLRDAGVDPMSPETYQAAIRRMSRDLDLLDGELSRSPPASGKAR